MNVEYGIPCAKQYARALIPLRRHHHTRANHALAGNRCRSIRRFHLRPRRSESARQRRRSRCAGSDGYAFGDGVQQTRIARRTATAAAFGQVRTHDSGTRLPINVLRDVRSGSRSPLSLRMLAHRRSGLGSGWPHGGLADIGACQVGCCAANVTCFLSCRKAEQRQSRSKSAPTVKQGIAG